MPKRILVINAGSSSLKCASFEFAGAPLVAAEAPFWSENISKPTVHEAVNAIPDQPVVVVGHRVVHGGELFSETVLIDDQVKNRIREFQTFAPLHNKLNLEGIETAMERFPGAKHVAVFDTAFHRTIPDYAAVYPLPYRYYGSQRIKRYGFHGINHEYCTERAALMLGKDVRKVNLIVCHLGNGCSLTAVVNGQSIDNSMGFTPLEGLMMGTRTGSIDPGIVIRMVRNEGMNGDEVDRVLNKESGLLGISGVSNDMREVIAAAKDGNGRAQLALDMFIYRLQSFIGAMSSHLPSIDAIVFTAGIGEHASLVRQRACEALRLHGCLVDPQKNDARKNDEDVSSSESQIPVLVITAREDWQIARACWRFA